MGLSYRITLDLICNSALRFVSLSQNSPKHLYPSYKTDLDFGDWFGQTQCHNQINVKMLVFRWLMMANGDLVGSCLYRLKWNLILASEIISHSVVFCTNQTAANFINYFAVLHLVVSVEGKLLLLCHESDVLV